MSQTERRKTEIRAVRKDRAASEAYYAEEAAFAAAIDATSRTTPAQDASMLGVGNVSQRSASDSGRAKIASGGGTAVPAPTCHACWCLQHEYETPNVHCPEHTASGTGWPETFTDREREVLQGGLILAAIHHDAARKEAEKDAANPRFKRQRVACLRVAAHHMEQLYQISELGAKCGLRNAWPRP